MDQLCDQELRGYKIIDRIGAGGFGVVFRAEQPAVGREVAIKVILPEYAEHPEFVERFEAEARTVAKLEHPHIVPLYDYWQDKAGGFLVMRWLPGGSLRDSLIEGPLSEATIGRLLEQITEALSVSHKHGVVHRDLKPENILFDEEGNAYLTDFGIAKDLARNGLTKTGTIVGSVDYLAPEQAKGEPVTAKTDIYALGVMLYEMLTGKHPFPGLDPVQTLQKQLNESLPSVNKARPELAPVLDEVIQTATAKDPDLRYPNVGEFWQAYLRVQEGEIPPAADQAGSILPAFLQDDESDREMERPVFVAREEELARVYGFLKNALSEKGQVAFVTGGAGRGKTALLNEFCRRAEEKHGDLVVASGNCNAHTGMADPYLPFRDVMGMLSGDVETRYSAGAIRRDQAIRLWRLLPHTVDATLERGASLLDVFVSGEGLLTRTRIAAPEDSNRLRRLGELIERRKSGTSELEQSLIFEQFTNVILILARHRPLLIVLDDLQWADRASLDLLFHLGRRIEGYPILILGAYRPDEVAMGRRGERHPLEAVVNELKRLYGEVEVDLTQEEELTENIFIQELLETEPNRLSPEFKEALKEHTGGHPLFTIELLRAMQERGDLVHDEDGQWVEGPELAWDRLPARVEAVIEERLSRLADELRELLSVASVEGENFTAQVVARVQEIKERQLLRELSQELENRHRLVREQEELKIDGNLLSRYRFAHHLYQRYLYNDLGAGERRLLHGEISEILEEILGEQADRYAVQLAWHYDQAGSDEKAHHFLVIAGNEARRKYANAEAIQHYTKALERLPKDHPDRFELLLARASVFDLIGEREKQRADVDELITVSEAFDNDEQRCDALLAETDYFLGTEYILAKRPVEKAIELAQIMRDKVRAGHAKRRLGEWAWYMNDPGTSRLALESAYDLFLDAGFLGEAARCLHALSLTLIELSENAAALEVAKKAVALSQECGDTRQEATGVRRIAIALFYQDQHLDALTYSHKALELHRKLGDRNEEVHALNVLGLNYAYVNELEEAERYLQDSLRVSKTIGVGFGTVTAVLNLLQVHYLPRGEIWQYLQFLEAQFQDAQVSENELTVIMLEESMALVLSWFGKYEQSLELIQSVLKNAERIGSNFDLGLGYSLICQLQAELRDFNGARSSFENILQRTRDTGVEIYQVYRSFDLAYIDILEGDADKIEKALKQLLEGINKIKAMNIYRYIVDWLDMIARIYLIMDEPGKAIEYSSEALEWAVRMPSPIKPEEKFFTHAKALSALGREDEAAKYLCKAYDRVMLVAEKTEDDELRRSWLDDVRTNKEILEAYSELGMGA